MLVQRLAILAALFGCELAAITILFDAESLPTLGVPGLIRLIGPLSLRVIVGFVALFLAVAYLKSGAALRAISGEVARYPLRPSFLAAHLAVMAAFGLYSVAFFGSHASDGIAVAWLVAGVAGVVLGACAFLPGHLWRALLARTDYAWAYAAVAVARQAGQDRLAIGRHHRAALRNDQRIVDRFGQIGEQLLHHLGGFQPGIGARADAILAFAT